MKKIMLVGEPMGLGATVPGAIAWRNATRIYALTPMEQDIILTHMWPLTLRALPRYRESMVVSCADKLCALCETFGLVRHLRSTDTMGWIAKLCRETG